FGQVFPINCLPAAGLADSGLDEISTCEEIKFDACRKYYERVDADVLFFFSDIAIQAEAMGARVQLAPDAMPSIAKPAASIAAAKPENCPRMRINAETTRRLAAHFPEKPLAALVYGPFTVTGQVMGEQAALKGIVHDPAAVKRVLDRSFSTALRYADFLFQSGAEILWISDPLAALLPPDRFREFAGDYLAGLFTAFAPSSSILHICGDISGHLAEIIRTGVSAISFDQCMDLLAVEDYIPKGMGIIGNIDPSGVIAQGPVDRIEEDVSDLCNMMGTNSDFVMSTGCALPPATPVENVEAFIRSAKERMNALETFREPLTRVRNTVFEGDGPKVADAVDHAGENEKVPMLFIVHAGLLRSVRKASAMYDAGKFFLPSLLLIAEAFYAGYDRIRHAVEPAEKSGADVILGTVKGDFHEIGKDLVRIFLEINGYRVMDLGVDVAPEEFITQAARNNASVIGLSAFITSAGTQLAEVIRMADQEELFCTRILVGGAAVNQKTASDIGADGYAKDAAGAAALVRQFILEPGPKASKIIYSPLKESHDE
ncbi:MAG: uroporphyrinogen decarboxylase family protein, partial [Thermodesulfobacteriota bacterium]